ncbi:MAG: hypothetical protein WCK81_08860 [Betaproteobacteria bacterium]
MKTSPFSAQFHAVVIALACFYAAEPAHAQTVYKCGNNYSDTPCPQAVSVPTSDPRTPAQKTQTDRATTQAATLAAQLEKSRHADEADALRRAQAQAKATALADNMTKKSKPDPANTHHKKGKKNKAAPSAAMEQASKPPLNKPKKPQAFTTTASARTQPKP